MQLNIDDAFIREVIDKLHEIVKRRGGLRGNQMRMLYEELPEAKRVVKEKKLPVLCALSNGRLKFIPDNSSGRIVHLMMSFTRPNIDDDLVKKVINRLCVSAPPGGLCGDQMPLIYEELRNEEKPKARRIVEKMGLSWLCDASGGRLSFIQDQGSGRIYRVVEGDLAGNKLDSAITTQDANVPHVPAAFAPAKKKKQKEKVKTKQKKWTDDETDRSDCDIPRLEDGYLSDNCDKLDDSEAARTPGTVTPNEYTSNDEDEDDEDDTPRSSPSYMHFNDVRPLKKTLMTQLQENTLPKERLESKDLYVFDKQDKGPHVDTYANFIAHNNAAELYCVTKGYFDKCKGSSSLKASRNPPGYRQKINTEAVIQITITELITPDHPEHDDHILKGWFLKTSFAGKMRVEAVPGNLYIMEKGNQWLYITEARPRGTKVYVVGKLHLTKNDGIRPRDEIRFVLVDYVRPFFLYDKEAKMLSKRMGKFVRSMLPVPTTSLCPEHNERGEVPENADLDESQKEAVEAVGQESLTVIQGPPGTGKSTTIASAVSFRRRKLDDGGFDMRSKIVVTAITNKAVSSILEKFIDMDMYAALPGINQEFIHDQHKFPFVLLGQKEKVAERVSEYLLDEIVNKLVDTTVADVRPIADAFNHFREAISDEETFRDKGEVLKIFREEGYNGVRDISNEWTAAFMEFSETTRRPTRNNWQNFADKVDLKSKRRINNFMSFKEAAIDFFELALKAARRKHLRMHRDYILENSAVLLSTIDGLAKKNVEKFKLGGRVDMVIIDEAAQVKEDAMGMIAFLEPECSVVLVGDHKQLRPFSNFRFNSERGEAKVMRSMMERCADLSKMKNHDIETWMLTTNYRNPPEVVDLLNRLFYRDTLSPGRPANDNIEHPFFPAICWIDHENPECTKAEKDLERTKSCWNVGEMKIVFDLYKTLKSTGKNNVVIITLYSSQMQKLKAMFVESSMEADANDVITVDSSQGSEADVVILSSVRSNPHGSIGFADNPNRLNVALSRAKYHLIIVGNRNTFTWTDKGGNDPKSVMWSQLIDFLADKDSIHSLRDKKELQPEDFNSLIKGNQYVHGQGYDDKLPGELSSLLRLCWGSRCENPPRAMIKLGDVSTGG